MMLRLWVLTALLHACYSAVSLEERVSRITSEAPSFHNLILQNGAFKLARNRAINTIISKRRKTMIKSLSLPKAVSGKKIESADDIFHISDDVFNHLDDLIPSFDDDTFSFDDDIFNFDDQFNFDDAFSLDDDYFSFDDDFWSFDDDTFSFDDDMWKADDDASYTSIDGYVSYAFTYGDTCAGTKTMEVGVVAGTCFSDYVSSYMLQFSDASCNGLRVSFYEDTSCTTLLYTVPLDGFTDCMTVPMSNGTFYNSAQGMCSPGYTVSVDMDSVLLTVFENSETCAGVPVVYAAVATDTCLTVDENESYELSCDSEFDIFSGTNYTSSASCAASSSGQQDFLFPMLCYDSSELSDLPISSYEMHRGHVGTSRRQKDDRALVKQQRTIQRVHTGSSEQPAVLKRQRSSGAAAFDKMVPLKVQTSSRQVRKGLYKRDQAESQKIKQAKADGQPLKVTRSQYHLRGPVLSSADDILHLDDDIFHLDDAMFSDDLIPSFDDDLFQLDDDIFNGFDDTFTFDDDFWSFDDQEFSFDDDFWSFDDLFSFDDDADDDMYSMAVFSFDIKCGTTGHPITYTPLPTVMPTGVPVALPTPRPTAMPSQSVPSTVSFFVTQILYGMSYTTYESDASLYQDTLIQSIAQCMTGVTSQNILSFSVADGSSTTRKLLFQSLTVNQGRVNWSGHPQATTDSLILTYTVSVDSSYDYQSLSAELQSNIADGQFDSYLSTNAQTNGATALTSCTSTDATTTQTTVNSIDDDASNGSGNGGLSGGGIAGVVIAVLVVVGVAAAVVYYFYSQKSMSSGDDRSTTSEASAASSTAAAKGPASEFVTLKDIQLTTTPVYGITTITNDKGNATDAHENL